MRRSADFGATVRYGRRAAQADIVIHARQPDENDDHGTEPMVGLIVAKSVGSAVERHRVARRLRHVAFAMLGELKPAEQVVIRALPNSAETKSESLERQLRDGMRGIHRAEDRVR